MAHTCMSTHAHIDTHIHTCARTPSSRFSHTLPTDPAALRVWDQLARRPDFRPPSVEQPQGHSGSTGSPYSALRSRLPRSLSGHCTRSSERFISSSVMQQQKLMADSQPRTVRGADRVVSTVRQARCLFSRFEVLTVRQAG